MTNTQRTFARLGLILAAVIAGQIVGCHGYVTAILYRE